MRKVGLVPAKPDTPIEALSLSLQRWTDSAQHRQERNIHRLNGMWYKLAQTLCNNDVAAMQPFYHEIGALLRTPNAGDPPVGALEERLRKLVNLGLRELFIVIAIREFLDRLITLNFPDTAPSWREISDEYLPINIQLGYLEGEVPRTRRTFGPGSRQ